MTHLRITVLGPFKTESDAIVERSASAGVRRLIAVLVAAGTDGVNKDELVAELWPNDRPASWKSMIRNRITQARRHLGPSAILNVANRYQLDPAISIDSWSLLSRIAIEDPEPDPTLEFLLGKPFAGVASTPLIDAHIRQIESARALQIRAVVDRSPQPLAAPQLERLRLYQREHGLDPAVAEQTVRALVMANEISLAHDVIDHSRRMVTQAGMSTAWVDRLELRGSGSGGPTAAPSSRVAIVEPMTQSPDRATMFRRAAEAGHWNVAYEVAMEGMPYAHPIGGDPERVELLLALPVAELDAPRQLQLGICLAVMLRHEDPAAAKAWAQLASEAAVTPDEVFATEVAFRATGEVEDERRLITLPAALRSPGIRPTAMKSYQVAVANHLERSSADQASDVVDRFLELVEVSDDSYRRWQGLILEAMLTFVHGQFRTALDQAKQACNYGTLFGIAECDFGWRTQVFNQAWATTRPGRVAEDAVLFSASHEPPFSEAFRAAASTSPAQLEGFLDSFDIDSRMSSCVPLLTLFAPRLENAETKHRIFERLSSRSGTSAIFGASYMHLGPVDRARAMLTDSPSQKKALLEDAIEVADTQQLPLWQVVCRIDLALHQGAVPDASALNEFATTPELQGLVNRHA